MILHDALKSLMAVATPMETWEVLTALRGYDIVGGDGAWVYTLKKYTTARLRAIFYQRPDDSRISWEKDSGAMLNATPLTKEMIVTRNKLLAKTSSHFGGHFIDGMQALKKAGYRIPDEEMDFSCVQEISDDEEVEI